MRTPVGRLPRAIYPEHVHELSICNAIARIVDEASVGQRVQIVRLDVGHLRQVVPETLRYCWDIAVRETALEGVDLDINYIPARISCHACGALTDIDVLVLRCGSCGSTDAELTAGDELSVSSIDVAEPSSTRPCNG